MGLFACLLASFLVLVAFADDAVAAPAVDVPQESPSLILALQEVKSKLEQERHLSGCFENGYKAIAHHGCGALDEIGKRRLALHFTGCHLSFAGRPAPPPCTDASLTSCLSQISTEQFGVFTSYTLHTDHLCYYLESRLWQRGTNAVIRNLLTGANDTARALAQVKIKIRRIFKVDDRLGGADLSEVRLLPIT
jgi:hypothetical protein